MKRIRMINRACFFMLISFVFIHQGKAQDAQVAASSLAYQVTVGDVYSLSYSGTTQIITLDHTYRIRIPNLGVINAAGKTFHQLKREIESIIINHYPQSGAQFSLTSPGSFTVYIYGEVNGPGVRSTWAMGRLSSLVYGSFTTHSSKRNITVTTANGQVKTYDLLKAERFGDLSQDPFLRPEDVITVYRVDRLVTVFGEIERPESYELLPGENLRDLITNYAGGYTALADVNMTEITRYIESGREVSNKIYPYLTSDGEGETADYPLQNLDVIYIPPK